MPDNELTQHKPVASFGTESDSAEVRTSLNIGKGGLGDSSALEEHPVWRLGIAAVAVLYAATALLLAASMTGVLP